MITTPTKRQDNDQRSEKIERIARVRTSSSNSYQRYKRGIDLILLVIAHALLLPVFLILWTIIPIAIWLEDRGPIFYTQRRVGRGGRVFHLIKFRSMIRNAEASTGPVLASDSDPRVTRVGRLLRATALDELPQVMNVWKGDISLIGPRPERPELLEQFAKDLPQIFRRLEVRPGLSGLAQVYGRYSSQPRDKLHYDIFYINKMSLMLDLKLLYLSILVTLRGKWQAHDKQNRHHGVEMLATSKKTGSHKPVRR